LPRCHRHDWLERSATPCDGGQPRYMHTFDELAEKYRETDEAKFKQYAELAVACATFPY